MPHYFVDGYNIIHSCHRLRPLLGDSIERARDALVERIAAFCAMMGDRVTLVFDGRDRGRFVHPALGGDTFEILYTSGEQSADALIERTVYNHPNRRDVVVVTGDQGIRQLCRGLGALVMGPENFIESMDGATKSARGVMQRVEERSGPIRLEDRLDDRTRRALEALRKKLEQK